jgi:hypothetical protein
MARRSVQIQSQSEWQYVSRGGFRKLSADASILDAAEKDTPSFQTLFHEVTQVIAISCRRVCSAIRDAKIYGKAEGRWLRFQRRLSESLTLSSAMPRQ